MAILETRPGLDDASALNASRLLAELHIDMYGEPGLSLSAASAPRRNCPRPGGGSAVHLAG